MKKKRMFKCVNLKYTFHDDWAFEIGRNYELESEKKYSYEFKITDEEDLTYTFLAPKECFEEVKKLIGYKLVKPEYESAVTHIIWGGHHELNSMKGIHFHKGSIAIDLLEKAGVLDLWCEPVYQETVKIPKINGVELEVKDDMISFGEYSLPRECFSTQIRYICLEKDMFFIGVNEMNEIREYLKKI